MIKIDSKTENQYLTFILENEFYAINVHKVKEIIEMPKITNLPHASKFLAGIINLRNQVIPVVDLRIKFNMEKVERTSENYIIILETTFKNETIITGALVDNVKAVTKINSEKIEHPPKIGTNINTKFIDAIAKEKENLIIILNTDSLFLENEIVDIHNSITYFKNRK